MLRENRLNRVKLLHSSHRGMPTILGTLLITITTKMILKTMVVPIIAKKKTYKTREVTPQEIDHSHTS